MFPSNQSPFGHDPRTAAQRGLDGMVFWAAVVVSLVLTPPTAEFAAPYAERLLVEAIGTGWGWAAPLLTYGICGMLCFNIARLGLAALATLAALAAARMVPGLI